MEKLIEITNLAIGLPKKIAYGEDKELETGICKKSVEEAYLLKHGFKNDDVADKKNHGGLDRAVCIYSNEHYTSWEIEFNASLPSSAFGENITAVNMLEEDVCIGDIYQLGGAVIQVTQGRIPCSTINKRTGIPALLKRIVEEGSTGFLCRVLKEGTVRRDSEIKLLQQHENKVSIMFANKVHLHNSKDVDDIKRILAVEELAENWRRQLENKLLKYT